MQGQTSTLGIDLYQKQQYAEAEAELLAGTSGNPGWAEGWRYLGFTQYGLAKHDLAAVSLERAIALEPDNAETRYGLGLVRAVQKQTDAAIACFEEALRLMSTHVAAKAALVGGLVYRGQQRIAANDFEHGEADLERASKLDRKSPAPVIALAKYYLAFNQEVRAGKVIENALASITNDPEINALAQQLNVKASAGAIAQQQQAQARQTVQQSQEVPCPVCKKMIMPWAVTCPYCMTQLKARPTSFDHLKGGPSTTWQEVTYYVISSLWVLDGLRPLIAALLLSSAGFSGFTPILVTVGVVKVSVAVGLLFRVEWLQFIAKIFCYVDILFSGWGFMMAMGLHQIVGMAITGVSLILTCMMLYLIGYMDG